LKALWFDHNGFCVLYKRLHRAVFDLPAPNGSSNAIQINAARLAELLRGVGSEPRRRNRQRDDVAA
jgi:transposase